MLLAECDALCVWQLKHEMRIQYIEHASCGSIGNNSGSGSSGSQSALRLLISGCGRNRFGCMGGRLSGRCSSRRNSGLGASSGRRNRDGSGDRGGLGASLLDHTVCHKGDVSKRLRWAP